MALFGNKVSDFMGNMKIDREISDLESKKQSLVRSIQNEVNTLQARITGIFTEVGSTAYDLCQSDDFSFERFTEKFAEVTTIKETIAAKEAKINEISSRYDEEITLLKNLNPPAPAAATAPAPTAPAASIAEPAGNCSACGAPHKAGDVFCRGCGNKLA